MISSKRMLIITNHHRLKQAFDYIQINQIAHTGEHNVTIVFLKGL